MKGIKKAIISLFLVTLCVIGFKIDTKAAVTGTLNVPANYNWDTGENPALTGKATFPNTEPVFTGIENPPEPASATDPDNYSDPVRKTVQITQGGAVVDDENATNYLYVWKKRKHGEAATLVYKISSSNTVPDKTTATAFTSDVDVPVSVNKDKAKAKFEPRSEANKQKEFKVMVDETTDVAQKTIEMFKVTPEANGIGATLVALSDPIYLLPGEKGTVSANKSTETARANNSDTVHKYNNCALSAGITKEEETATGSSVEVKVAMSTTAAATSTVTFNYDTVKMNLGPYVNTTALNPGQTDTRTINGGYTSADYASSKVSTESITGTPWTGTSFSYTIPGLSSNTHTLYITMKDGNVFTGQVLVEDVAVNMSTVKVTKNQKVKLSRYITDSNPTTKYVSVSPIGNYVTISASSGTAGSINVTGNSTVTTETDGLKVNNVARKVIVYDIPTITTNDSSSSSTELGASSSSKNTYSSALKVVVPTSDYHDDMGWDGINTARIDFAGSKDTKSTYVKLSGSGTTASKELSSADLFSILDSVCKGSKDDVTITVYPLPKDSTNVNDYDPLVKASTTITAYKIELDTSAGAKYKINGSDYNDDFYALKGTKFTISSSAKNSGDKFQRWDNSNNDNFSTESDSFKADGSKTFKAVYGSTTPTPTPTPTTTPNGGNTDDYDDVPKTGESKADIWILWSVLFIAILGAGFMIWKRFGLVRAIAAAEEEYAIAEEEERIETEKKEKEDKLNMLKDLRNL